MTRTGWAYVGCAAAAGGVFVALVGLLPLGRQVVLVVDDCGQLLAACLASAACADAARRSRRHRPAWTLLAVATACWAGGQAVWTVYEVGIGREVPFPSAADAGFLAFPLAAAAGLGSWLGRAGPGVTRARDTLDGAVIAGSLLLLSWVTVLGDATADAASGTLASLLSLAYPVGDVVVLTLVLMTVSRTTGGDRGRLVTVAAGLGALAFADSAYLYLVTSGSYASGNVISGGWVLGFLLVAAGAAAPGVRAEVEASALESRQLTRPMLLLPYVPLAVAGTVVVAANARSGRVPAADLALGLLLVVMVLTRQLLVLAENLRLLTELRETRDALHQQALHDPLTGLANRTLFLDRVEHALAARSRRREDFAVLFCDLDGFKAVNDELGHPAGDDLLRGVATRLRDRVRPEDTVARLGGDEFAVLLADSADAGAVAERLVTAVRRPVRLGGREVRVGVSVGVALSCELPADVDDSGPGAIEQLLRVADAAMYRAKAAGRQDPAGPTGPSAGASGPASPARPARPVEAVA